MGDAFLLYPKLLLKTKVILYGAGYALATTYNLKILIENGILYPRKIVNISLPRQRDPKIHTFKRKKTMIKILFICHGNICRSPMAEFIMKQLVQERGYEDQIYIESAATSTEEIGNGVYPPVKRLLAARGIDCSQKRARRVTEADYEKFDLLVCMDSNNLRNLNRMFTQDDGAKISKLLDFTAQPHDVADPWYTGDFLTTQQDVINGCEALLEQIIK